MAPRRAPAVLAALLAGASASVFAASDRAFERDANPKAALTAAGSEARSMPAPAAGPRGLKGASSGFVWVSVGREDIEAAAAGFPLGVPIAGSSYAALYRVEESRLGALAQYMHERHGKCGGFFAHETEEEARRDLSPRTASAGGPYTIDQRALVAPLIPRVQEAELLGTINALAALHNRYYTSDTGVSAASWVQARWQALVEGRSDASVELYRHPNWKQPSVILTFKGLEKPDEVVVLGGHLDSIAGYWGGARARAPGADDNASGIAILTETIRVLAQSGVRPARTVQFMAYAAEEVGLRGSKAIASDYAGRGVKVAGVIQFDMTNFKGSGSDIYLIGDNTDSAQNAYLGRLIDEYVKVSWGTMRCGYGCSDHASWTRAGFPASAAFESEKQDMNPNIHTADDTLANSGGNAKHSVAFAKLAVAYAVETAKGAQLRARGDRLSPARSIAAVR